MAMATALICGATGASAQTAPPSPLTLGAAVDFALQNHPSIRQAAAGASAATEEIAVARSAYLPKLDLLWQANRSTRNNVFGLLLPQSVIPSVSGPVLPSGTSSSVWSAAGGLLFSWEAVDFGRRAAGLSLARAESDAAGAEKKAVDLEIAGAAADAYLAVAAADAAQQAARANVDRLQTFAATVKALVDNQLRAGAEQSRADAELAAARNRLIESERDAAIARLTLAEALGVPGSAVTIAAADLLNTPPRVADSAAFDPSMHPEAVAAAAQMSAAEARDKVIDLSALPRVDVQTAIAGRGVSRDVAGVSTGTAFGFDVPNWAVGIQVSFPSMEMFRAQPRRRAERERLNAAKANYDRTVQSLHAQNARARAVIDAAYAIAANTPRQLQAARDSDTQARARYSAGLTNVLEVAEAQRLLAEAEAETAVANLSVWRALLADAMLRGDLSSFLTRTRAPQPAADHPEE